MPRKCVVPVVDAVSALTKYMDHFQQSEIPISSSPVWQHLAKECNGHWKAYCWWTNVAYDRRRILTLAREEMGIKIIQSQRNVHQDYSLARDFDISFHRSESEEDEGDSWFDLILDRETWTRIKPSDEKLNNRKRSNNSLRAQVRTNVIADEFYKQHKLPCAFSFGENEISKSSDKAHYLKINGYCRAKSCNNSLHAYLDNEPSVDDEEIVIRIRTRNTSREVHEDVKRYLNGEKRKNLGRESHAEGCSNLLKRLKREQMERGEIEGPIIPKADVLRHAHQEHVEYELGIKKDDQDIIERIYNLQFEKPYMGSINAVGYNPFYAIYGLPIQITLFQKFCDVMKDWSCISIDGTGSLVRKLLRPLGLKSGHIFLHCIVIHFGGEIVSVFQLLSESQEAETFTCWLRRWLRWVKIKPKQCVTDCSRALFLACAKAFNNMTIKEYLNFYFLALCNGNVSILNGISTYLRIDVAHLIHMVCRWDATKAIKRLPVRDFFIRCIALMVDCQYLQEFQKIFLLTCAVGLNCQEDTVLDLYSGIAVKKAREILENYMCKRRININEHLENLETTEHEEIPSFDTNDEINGTSNIENYITKLVLEARAVRHAGIELNAFYVPKFIDQLIRIGGQFLLWTAVGVPFFVGHASSACSEKNFQDYKDKVLKKYGKKIGCEKFMKINMNDVNGATRSMTSKLTKFIVDKDELPAVKQKVFSVSRTPNADDDALKFKSSEFENVSNISNENETSSTIINDSDLMSRENWKGKTGLGIFDQYWNDDDEPEEQLIISVDKTDSDVISQDFKNDINDEDKTDNLGNDGSEEGAIKYLCNYCFTLLESDDVVGHDCSSVLPQQSILDEYLNNFSMKSKLSFSNVFNDNNGNQ